MYVAQNISSKKTIKKKERISCYVQYIARGRGGKEGGHTQRQDKDTGKQRDRHTQKDTGRKRDRHTQKAGVAKRPWLGGVGGWGGCVGWVGDLL